MSETVSGVAEVPFFYKNEAYKFSSKILLT